MINAALFWIMTQTPSLITSVEETQKQVTDVQQPAGSIVLIQRQGPLRFMIEELAHHDSQEKKKSK